MILRNWIPQDLFARLPAAGENWIAAGQRATADDANYGDYVFAQRPNERTMFRVNCMHNKGQAASLELLGCPQVLAVAESLCGPNFVPTYESHDLLRVSGRRRHCRGCSFRFPVPASASGPIW